MKRVLILVSLGVIALLVGSTAVAGGGADEHDGLLRLQWVGAVREQRRR